MDVPLLVGTPSNHDLQLINHTYEKTLPLRLQESIYSQWAEGEHPLATKRYRLNTSHFKAGNQEGLLTTKGVLDNLNEFCRTMSYTDVGYKDPHIGAETFPSEQ